MLRRRRRRRDDSGRRRPYSTPPFVVEAPPLSLPSNTHRRGARPRLQRVHELTLARLGFGSPASPERSRVPDATRRLVRPPRKPC
jgi:hypothetical protein